MNINYLITYTDPDSGDEYETHAETFEEAKQTKEDLIDEGWEDIIIERYRL
jgi:hypothetical protein